MAKVTPIQPDLSAVPIWNSATKDRRHGGVLIAPDLILMIKHFPLGENTEMEWLHNNGHGVVTSIHRVLDRVVQVGQVVVGVLDEPVSLITPLPIAQPYDGWKGTLYTLLYNGTLRAQAQAYRQGSRMHWIIPLADQTSGQPVFRVTKKGLTELVSLADGPNDGPVLPSLAKIKAAVAKVNHA